MSVQIQIIDIANELYEELGSPDNISVGSVNLWLLQNVGQLNGFINAAFSLVDSGDEITPLLNEDEKSIYKSLYLIYYYDKMIRTGLGASSFNSVQEITSDGGTIRRTDRVRLAQVYIQLRKEEMQKLKDLATSYKLSNSLPTQITGDDVYTDNPRIINPGVPVGRVRE